MSKQDSGSDSNGGEQPGSGETRDEKPTTLSLRTACKGAVDATNSALQTMEHTVHNGEQFIGSRLRPLGRQFSYAGQRVVEVYERREAYGPQIITGAAVAFGGLTALRRGRVPGALMGALAGSGAYAGVYGVEIYPATNTKNDS
jgi:hypothetical protein